MGIGTATAPESCGLVINWRAHSEGATSAGCGKGGHLCPDDLHGHGHPAKTGRAAGFVITQSLFKTAGAGAGFRRFSIPRGDGRRTPLRILCVEDMVSLQPFEGASNRTAVMVLEKGKPTAYPVPYTVWRKQGRKRFTYDSTLEEVTNATVRLKFVAEPVNPSDPTSPWLTARPKAIKAIRKVLGKSDYEAHAGVCTWLQLRLLGRDCYQASRWVGSSSQHH
jgi:hypothetical protein